MNTKSCFAPLHLRMVLNVCHLIRCAHEVWKSKTVLYEHIFHDHQMFTNILLQIAYSYIMYMLPLLYDVSNSVTKIRMPSWMPLASWHCRLNNKWLTHVLTFVLKVSNATSLNNNIGCVLHNISCYYHFCVYFILLQTPLTVDMIIRFICTHCCGEIFVEIFCFHEAENN